MLTEKQATHCQAALARRGVRAWHVHDPQAPELVRDFGRCLKDRSLKPTYIDAIGTAGESFELARWTGKRNAFVTLLARATPRDLGHTAAELADEDNYILVPDTDGEWLPSDDDLDNGSTMPEFIVAIKRISSRRDAATMKALRPQLHQRDSGTCGECQCRIAAEHCEVDHIVPYGWGGDERIANLRIVCPDCNRRRHDCKKEFVFAWAHAAGILDTGWTPRDLRIRDAEPEAAWRLAEPDVLRPALTSGAVNDERAVRQRHRRIEREAAQLALLREKFAGTEFVPEAERDNPWDDWPERIKADPMRYAGKDDYEFLAELGEPIACGDGVSMPRCTPDCDGHCESNDPRRRSRLRQRLNRILKKLVWSFGRYEHEEDADGKPLHTPRRHVPPGCNLIETMGEGFHLGDLCIGGYGGGSMGIELGLDASGNIRIGPPESFTHAPTRAPPEPQSATAIPEPSSSTVLAGQRFAITGAFKDFSRDEIVTLISRSGGIVTTAVSRKTDCLIAGERAGAKLARAREYGVAIRDLDGLRQMIFGEQQS